MSATVAQPRVCWDDAPATPYSRRGSMASIYSQSIDLRDEIDRYGAIANCKVYYLGSAPCAKPKSLDACRNAVRTVVDRRKQMKCHMLISHSGMAFMYKRSSQAAAEPVAQVPLARLSMLVSPSSNKKLLAVVDHDPFTNDITCHVFVLRGKSGGWFHEQITKAIDKLSSIQNPEESTAFGARSFVADGESSIRQASVRRSNPLAPHM